MSGSQKSNPGCKKEEIWQEIQSILQDCIAFRQDRHQYPDLTWDEEDTARAIEQQLAKIDDIQVSPRLAQYGLVATMEGEQPGPTHIALRADMDGLPMQERSQLSYRSQRDGKMHACGHDGHMAILLGSLHVLQKLRKHLKGRVSFVFQPAEEGGAGAKALCESGVLDGVDAIFGLHGWPELELGRIACRPGPLLAGQSRFKLHIQVKGGHAAMPHLAQDAILLGSQIVQALQTVVSRNVEPAESAVISVTQFHAGTAHNILPDEAMVSGTIRALRPEILEFCENRIRDIATSLAGAFEARIDCEFIPGYPPTINHPREVDFVQKQIEAFFGDEVYCDLQKPSMGSEDFSYYLQEKPGAFFLLGLNTSEKPQPSLHHPEFDFQDQALPYGIATFCQLALAWGHQAHA